MYVSQLHAEHWQASLSLAIEDPLALEGTQCAHVSCRASDVQPLVLWYFRVGYVPRASQQVCLRVWHDDYLTPIFCPAAGHWLGDAEQRRGCVRSASAATAAVEGPQ